MKGCFMERLSLRMSDNSKRQINERYKALPGFTYKNGYTLSTTDLGDHGVKIELNRAFDVGGAVILPPDKVHECGRWMLKSLGQNSLGLSTELVDVLQRIIRHKKASKILERGDKKKIKDALKILRREKLEAETEEKVFRLISANAI